MKCETCLLPHNWKCSTLITKQQTRSLQMFRSDGVPVLLVTKQSKVEHYVATCVTVAQGRVMQWKCIVRWLVFSTAETHPVDLLSAIGSSRGQQPTLYSAVRFWALFVPTVLQAQINKHIACRIFVQLTNDKCRCVFHALLCLTMPQGAALQILRIARFEVLLGKWCCLPLRWVATDFWKNCTAFISKCLLCLYLIRLSKASTNLPHIATPVYLK